MTDFTPTSPLAANIARVSVIVGFYAAVIYCYNSNK